MAQDTFSFHGGCGSSDEKNERSLTLKLQKAGLDVISIIHTLQQSQVSEKTTYVSISFGLAFDF